MHIKANTYDAPVPVRYYAISIVAVLCMSILVYFFWHLAVNAYQERDLTILVFAGIGLSLYLYIVHVVSQSMMRLGHRVFGLFLVFFMMLCWAAAGALAREQYIEAIEEQQDREVVYQCMYTYPRTKECEHVLEQDLLKDKARYQPTLFERGVVRVLVAFE